MHCSTIPRNVFEGYGSTSWNRAAINVLLCNMSNMPKLPAEKGRVGLIFSCVPIRSLPLLVKGTTDSKPGQMRRPSTAVWCMQFQMYRMSISAGCTTHRQQKPKGRCEGTSTTDRRAAERNVWGWHPAKCDGLYGGGQPRGAKLRSASRAIRRTRFS
jgi:hypothetical protein